MGANSQLDCSAATSETGLGPAALFHPTQWVREQAVNLGYVGSNPTDGAISKL